MTLLQVPIILFIMFLYLAINVPLFQTFEYQYISSNQTELPVIGGRVAVNFRNKETIGLVLDIRDEKLDKNTNYKIKDILYVIDYSPIVDNNLISLFRWTSSYYHYPIGETIFNSLPKLLKTNEKLSEVTINFWSIKNKNYEKIISPRAKSCLKAMELLKEKKLDTDTLINLGISKSTLKKIQDLQLVDVTPEKIKKNSWNSEYILSSKPNTLNDEQLRAYNEIINSNGFNAYLLNGITGSGKTEVYLQVINKTLHDKQQVLVLVPEINLTPQTISRFCSRFAVPIVCINSSMTPFQKLHSYLQMLNNEAAILIGTRSSIFTSIPNLGLIIIDEEHDSSYKQSDYLRYSARDLCVVYAKMRNIPIVLGSATPSFESIQNVYNKKYKELLLTKRAGNAKDVIVKTIDMRKEQIIHGISQSLFFAIDNTIKRKEQVLLLLNRRGYAQQLICHNCGYVFTCHQCDANMYLHTQDNSIKCHCCEHSLPAPRICPECSSSNLIPIGNGTEQIEEYLKKSFSGISIARIDRDSTSLKGSLENYLNAIIEQKYDIIIGTQIMAKGHHFPNVTLVGIIDIDYYIYSNDFRAIEKMSQLITQVGGRAGRADKQGYLLLQTHMPNNPFLVDLLKYGYNKIAQKGLLLRQKNNNPPFTYLASIKADATNKNEVKNFLVRVYSKIITLLNNFPTISITNPRSNMQEKRINRYHMQIIIKGNNRKDLSDFLDIITNLLPSFKTSNNLHTVIEVDPQSIQ